MVALAGLWILVEALVERGALDEAQQILVENRVDGELPDIRPATVLLISRGALSYARGDQPRRSSTWSSRERGSIESVGKTSSASTGAFVPPWHDTLSVITIARAARPTRRWRLRDVEYAGRDRHRTACAGARRGR